MNNLRRFCAVLILAMALASAARAEGPINCPGITQQPTEQTSTSETEYGVVDVLTGLFVTALSVV